MGIDGVSYPYNPEDPGYLSAFPTNFRGYFKCGSRDHNIWREHSLKNANDKNLMDRFYKKLRIHKPKFRSIEKLRTVRISISHYHNIHFEAIYSCTQICCLCSSHFLKNLHVRRYAVFGIHALKRFTHVHRYAACGIT